MKLITYHSLVLLSEVEGSLTTGANRRRGLPSVALAKEGQIFVIILILLFVITLLLLSMYSRIAQYIISSRGSLTADQTTALADAGIDVAINKLNSPSTFPNYAGNETIILQIGQVKIYPISTTGNSRSVTSEGCIPNCTSPTAQRKVTATIERPELQVSFPYALHGLDTGATEAVSINSVAFPVNGNVHSNNTISCTGTSPQIDNSRTRNYVTSLPSASCGTPVNPTAQQLAPILNIGNGTTSGWKKAATDGGCYGTCPENLIVSTPRELGPIKIYGDLTINAGGNVSVKGPIWVTGNLTLDAPATGSPAAISANNSLNSCGGTVIAVDGSITINRNSTIIKSSSGYYLILAQTQSGVGKSILITNSTNYLSQFEAIFYSADDNGSGLSNISLSSSKIQVISGIAIGKLVSVTGSQFTSGAGLLNLKFCGLSNTFVVKRGTYKISK